MYKVKEINHEGILFENGAKIYDYHEQDWCESVYASWQEGLEDTYFKEQVHYEIEIELVEDYGIRINGYGIPCYNRQNGYYSSELKIIFEKENGEQIIYDASNYVIDDIQLHFHADVWLNELKEILQPTAFSCEVSNSKMELLIKIDDDIVFSRTYNEKEE